MAYRKKVPTTRRAVPGFQDMQRVKRAAEVVRFRKDLRDAEMRRNYALELGNIHSALFGKITPGVQHPLHNRREEVERLFLNSLLS